MGILPLTGSSRPPLPPTVFPTDVFGTILAVTVAMVDGTLDQPTESDFAVDATNGNDADPGTPSQPWKTLSKVASSTFSPGDVIGFKRGETWDEGLTFPSSGVSGNPIKVQAYGTGAKPVFRGSDDVLGVTGDWTLDSGNRWFRTFIPDSDNAFTDSVVYFDGTATKYMSAASTDVDAADEWFYDTATNRLYVFATSNPASAYTSLRATSRSNALNVASIDWVDFSDLVLKEANQIVRLNGATNLNFTEVEASHSGTNRVWAVDGACDVINLNNCAGYQGGSNINIKDGNDHGMKVGGSSTGIVVDGEPAINPNPTDGAWGSNGEDGFQVQTTGAGVVLTIKNVTSKENVENGLDIKRGSVTVEDTTFGSGRSATGGKQPITTQNNNGTLRLIRVICQIAGATGGNIVNFQAGKHICKECSFLGGTATTSGVNLTSSLLTQADFENCLFVAHSTAGQALLELNPSVPASFVAKVDHCTFFADTDRQLIELTSGKMDINNSIFMRTIGGNVLIHVRYTGANQVIGDNNLLHNDAGGDYVKWDGVGYNATEVTDGTLQADEGVGDNWLTGDPLFIDEANEDFHLNSGSAAREATSSGSTTTIDRDGQTRAATATDREVGAFEFP